MLETYGGQQGDEWTKIRIGRITGSQLGKVASYLTRASGSKKAGDSSAERDKYKRQTIAERLTGTATNNYVSESMKWGTNYEDEARVFYEGYTNSFVDRVNFVVHPDLPNFGSSPDGLIGKDGVLEIKCPESVTHLQYLTEAILPVEYVPQVVGEVMCTGRDFVDFVSYDPRFDDPAGRMFLVRTLRSELKWNDVRFGEIVGEQVIAFFEDEVRKFEAEIQEEIHRLKIKPIAPFPVRLKEER